MAHRSYNATSRRQQRFITEIPLGFPPAIKDRLVQAGLSHLIPAQKSSGPKSTKSNEYRNTWTLSCGTKPAQTSGCRLPDRKDKNYDQAFLTCVVCHKSRSIHDFRERSGEMRELRNRRTDDTESVLPDSMGSGEMREPGDRRTDDTESVVTHSKGSVLCPHSACSRYDARARECNYCHAEQPAKVLKFYLSFVVGILRVSLDGYRKKGLAKDVPFGLSVKSILKVWEDQGGLCAISKLAMTFNQCAFKASLCMEKANAWLRFKDIKKGLIAGNFDLIRREYAEPQIHNAFSLRVRNGYGKRGPDSNALVALRAPKLTPHPILPPIQTVRVHYEPQFQTPMTIRPVLSQSITPHPILPRVSANAQASIQPLEPLNEPPSAPLPKSSIDILIENFIDPSVESLMGPLIEPPDELPEPSIELDDDAFSEWLTGITTENSDCAMPDWLTGLATEIEESSKGPHTGLDLGTEAEGDQWVALEQGSVHVPIDTDSTCENELFGGLLEELSAPQL